MRKKISQREALRLKKRIRELEGKMRDLKNNWAGERIDSWSLSDAMCARVKTAKTLGFSTWISPTYSGTEVEIKAIML